MLLKNTLRVDTRIETNANSTSRGTAGVVEPKKGITKKTANRGQNEVSK